MIYDVKMDLTRKASMMEEGHLNDEVSVYMLYSSIVERDSIHIGLMIAFMNVLDILDADVVNVYLNAKPREGSHVKRGPELFGVEYEDRYASIVRALYGSRTSGTALRHHFTNSFERYWVHIFVC